MCCIIHRPRNSKEINKNNLEKIIKKNPHGWGVSFMSDNGIFIYKSMDMTKAIEYIRELEKKNVEFLFHARWATHGEKNIKNCHPYRFNKGALFHNGKITGNYKNSKMSDSWHFARLLDKKLKKKTINDIINNNIKQIGESRFAFMMNNGEVITHGKWNEIDGCQYSKLDWQSNSYNYNYYSWGYGHEINDIHDDADEYNYDNKESAYKKAVESCKRYRYIYSHIVKQLTTMELFSIIKDYPDVMSEYYKKEIGGIV